MRVNVLGTIEVNRGGRVLRPTGAGQRALLAALALEQGKVVPVDRLTRIVWGDAPPATARTKIQAHVSAVRQAIGSSVHDSSGPLLTIPPGYLLSEQNAVTDLAEFSALAERGHRAADTGQADLASSLLGEALVLWRGSAFADVSAPAIRGAATMLAGRRLLAAETKAEADLALARWGTVVTELSALLISYPMRERLRGLLMIALHGLGCRADALSVYRAGHELMVQELGIEPGGWLRGHYRRILADEARPEGIPSLEPGPETTAPAPALSSDSAA